MRYVLTILVCLKIWAYQFWKMYLKDVLVRYKYPDNLQRLQSMERLERLWSLQSLKGMGDIEVFQGDYRELEIPKKEKCVIYCDPPYINTEGYFTNFSHEEFYDWAK